MDTADEPLSVTDEMPDTTDNGLSPRERILQAAAILLAEGGREAVSTRAISAVAKVQPPTIYRHFGDMQGLLDAVARETFAKYVRQKTTREHTDDPIEDLRQGWNLHVAFGLDNPAVYALIYGNPTAVDATASRDAYNVLYTLVARAAEAGQLRVSVPHAARLIAAAGEGVTLSLIATASEARDAHLSATMREAVIAAITISPASDEARDGAAGPKRVAARAVALRAVLGDLPGVLSRAEQHLLGEWLDRLADANR